MTTPETTTAAAAAGQPGWAGQAGQEGAARRWVRLTLLHARYQFIETVRVPIAVLGIMLFPALAMVFFVVPQQEVANDPILATASATQLGAFAIASACMFTFGAGVSEDRSKPFHPYLRTLPVGAGPPLAGRVLNGVGWAFLSLLPLVLLAGFLTAATLPWHRALLLVVAVPAVAMPFTLLGIAIGYAMSPKAAIAVVQATLFPLAFAGGMFLPPMMFPAWLDAISTATPTRGARELFIAATTGEPLEPVFLAVLVGWTVVFAVLTVTAYRRDEGRRFR